LDLYFVWSGSANAAERASVSKVNHTTQRVVMAATTQNSGTICCGRQDAAMAPMLRIISESPKHEQQQVVSSAEHVREAKHGMHGPLVPLDPK
jgi:hypothetical protein